MREYTFYVQVGQEYKTVDIDMSKQAQKAAAKALSSAS